MKHEKLISALTGAVLAFLVSMGAVACLVTGFDMAVELKTVALWCGVASVLGAVCFTLPLYPVPACVATLTGVILWLTGRLELSVEALLYRLSRMYNRAHGWSILRLNYYTADDLEPMLWLSLCFLGALIAIGITWAICRRKTAIPGVLGGLLCLVACLITTMTVPDIPWLFCLILGVLSVMLTHSVRREDPAQGNRLSLFGVPVLLLGLLILFLAVPQSNYTGDAVARTVVDSVLSNELFQSVFGDLTAAGTSGSNVSGGTVNLSSVGERINSQVELLQVHTDFSGILYLRGRSLDAYDGLSWTDSGVSTAQLNWPGGDALSPLGEVQVLTRYAHRMLYLPYYVRSTDLTDMTRGLENTKKLNQYSFTTGVVAGELSQWEETTTQDLTPYLHLKQTVKKWATPMAQKITEGKTTVYEKAQAIGNYVRASARYDLKTAAMPALERDFVRWFLEDSDTGYCVHFASSAVVLLQAAGIPARYITGYMTRVGKDCYTTVREEDAHAWVEYWLPGFGWTILEVTPSAQTDQEQPQEVPMPEKPPVSWNWKYVGYVSAGVLVALLMAMVIQRSVRLCLRRQALHAGSVKQQILAYWQEATLFAKCLGGLPDDRLYGIAERAKFSRKAPREQDLALFEAYISDAKRQLKKHSIFRRFYYRVVLALY